MNQLVAGNCANEQTISTPVRVQVSNMTSSMTTIVQKHWNYCNVLRDDGMSHGGYVERLACLLFLIVSDEHNQPPSNNFSPVLPGYDRLGLLIKGGSGHVFFHGYRYLRKLPVGIR